MTTKEEQIQELEKAIAQGQGVLAQAELDILQNTLDSLRGSKTQQPMSSMPSLQSLQQLIAVSSGLSPTEVEQIAEKVVANSQIGIAQLAPEVRDLIESTKKMTINISSMLPSGQVSTYTTKTSGGNRALFYVILSDFAAGNNVYLYGPAGTGKTYIAKEIAKTVNYKVITINCNQYTSPIEIIGGQTIEGYQEGKLAIAWGADPKKLGINPITNTPYEGALLLIDELPKLDPNTAGIMNEALSLLKDPPTLDANGQVVPKMIMNGRNEEIKLGNLFVIGTGNTQLLRPDPTYTANFAQDASLQDRFAGSTYRVFYDYEMEYKKVFENSEAMIGQTRVSNINMAFLFNFMIKLRKSIETNNFGQEAFVSMRIMNNLRDTYLQYRSNEALPQGERNIRPKTLEDGVRSFLSLFTDAQRLLLIPQEVDEFINVIIPEANSRPLEEVSTDAQIDEAKQIVEDWKNTYGNRIL
jgi:hypothetical protein